MKSLRFAFFGLSLFTLCLNATARDTAPRYKFTAGQTNVYAVEISVRSENGSDSATGNVFVVTRSAGTNSAIIACRAMLKTENKRTPPRGPYFGSYYGGNFMPIQNVFANDCEIELDLQGNELRDPGDYVLAVPLGKLAQSLFEPFPAKSLDGENSDTVMVLDDPFWLGPAANFLNIRQNGQPISMNYYYNGQRSSLAALAVSRSIVSRAKKSLGDALEWHQQTQLESMVKTSGEPRLKAACEADFTFDRSVGLLTSIEKQGDVTSQTETSSRHAKVSFKAHLLSGDELAAALAPPPPPALPRKLAGAELEKFTADLKSADIETRRGAMRQLNGAEIESPSAELIDLVAGLALDSDSFVKMTAANFVGPRATANQVPVLLKMLKDADWSARQNAAKALGRLKDERAIQPLADLVARGSNMGSQDASSALINIGAPAEKAVIALLSERNAETQRQACSILQQIGTDASIDPLQKLVGDSEQQTSQAAVDAIRAIKQRQ